MEERLLTRKDLMNRWGISERTLCRWTHNKNIPYLRNKINGRVYFKKEEIEEWEKEMNMSTFGNQG